MISQWTKRSQVIHVSCCCSTLSGPRGASAVFCGVGNLRGWWQVKVVFLWDSKFLLCVLLFFISLKSVRQRRFPTGSLGKAHSWSKMGSLGQCGSTGRWSQCFGGRGRKRPELHNKKSWTTTATTVTTTTTRKKEKVFSISYVSVLISWHIKQSSFSKFKTSKLYKEIEISLCTFIFSLLYPRTFQLKFILATQRGSGVNGATR